MYIWDRINNYLGLVRFAHTIFALPFALIAMLAAANGLPAWPVIGWILFCMVTARTSAMTFNRIVDRRLDAQNPRTQSRHLPRGQVSLVEASILWLASSLLFIFGAWQLNSLAFGLSPIALLIICGYSYFKRFSSASHFILGLSLGIAPVGAWIGVTGAIGLPSIVLAMGVLLWVAGCDTIYALMDEEFDRKTGLHSLVVGFGKQRAMKIAFALHVFCIFFIALFGYTAGLGWMYYFGTVLFAALIIYEHIIVNPENTASVNIAFFNINGTISIGLFLFVAADILWL
ncbi:4-hydroxybenzoate octaprenyltransferase [bacterium]|nr:4-hydroxybenzoate octaprenyltransferase [bacterium]